MISVLWDHRVQSICYGCAVGKKWLRFSFAKNCGFWFGFTKLIAVSGFIGSVRPTFVCRRQRHLSFTPLRYDGRNDVLPRWIGPTKWQPKWLIASSAEIPDEDKYFDCRSYYVGRWTVNETMWKTIPKPPKSVFLKTEPRKPSFWFLNFEVGSVFRKVISDIFIGFHTPLLIAGLQLNVVAIFVLIIRIPGNFKKKLSSTLL